MPTSEELKALQSLSWQEKVLKTQTRIYEWYRRFDGQVYLSFSGGKDSTVLAHIIRGMGLKVEKVFADTGLEYPEIRNFVKSFGDVTIIRPSLRFDEVIKRYGYPIISKDAAHKLYGARRGASWALKYFDEDYSYNGRKSRFCIAQYKPLLSVDFSIANQCCDVMKKAPFHQYERRTGKKPIVATMTDESVLRRQAWLKNGCNSFSGIRQRSAPMSFWKEQDVLAYIRENGVNLCDIYGEVAFNAEKCSLHTTGCNRSGCIYCAFGMQIEEGESRFQRLKRTHPRQYEYCLGGGGYAEDGLWKPTREGLGLRHVFDAVNEALGKEIMRY